MKKYIKAFMPDFRPIQGSDVSFDLLDFQDKDFRNEFCLEEGESGIYIISATDGTKYTYPNGKTSPIIYIGKSDNLIRRLRDEHYYKGLKRLLDDPDYGIAENFQISPLYQYMYYNGSHIDVFKCRGNQSSKNLESLFLNQFYQKYRALPVANGARSYEIEME